jgi:cell wall-associated NlpC family hydrolase
MKSFVGIPYNKKDCFNLAKYFYKEEFNIELKHYFDDLPKNRNEMCSLIYTHKGDFKKIKSPEYGDLILLKIRGVESHIAIFVGEGLMLHTTEKTGSVIDRLSRWANMVSGYYTLRDVVND